MIVQATYGNRAGGPIDDAARELADLAFSAFSSRVREELPDILAENREQLRTLATDAIKGALADQPIDARIEKARSELVRGLFMTAVGAAVGAAVLTVVLERVTR